MRISMQACVEGEDSSPRVISIGCVERDAGVDPASGLGLFLREAHELLRQTQTLVLNERADEFVRVAAGCWPADADWAWFCRSRPVLIG